MTDGKSSTLRTQLRALVDVLQTSTAILLPHSTRELLDSIVEAAATIFGARAASIALIREQENTLEFMSAYGAGREELVGRKLQIDRGIAGFVALTGQALAISDVEQDPRFDRDFAASTGYVPGSILAAPLERGDRVVGVLEVLDKVDAPGFAMHDLELMGIFGRQAAIAIEQTGMLDQLNRLLRDGLVELANGDEHLGIDQLVDAFGDGSPGPPVTELRAMAQHIGRLYSAGEHERQACMGVLETLSRYLDQRQALH